MEIAVTSFVILVILVIQVRELAPPDFTFVAGAVALTVFGVIRPDQLTAGFANEGLLTVAMLFVVAAGVRETGLTQYLSDKCFGQGTSEQSVFKRMAALVIPMSSILNNTPVVAILVPTISDWCKRHASSPSRLLLPLSYLAILGGTCTLIGTSTNILVNSFLGQDGSGVASQVIRSGTQPLHFFEIGAVGLPYAILGLVYIWMFRSWIPERWSPLQVAKSGRRNYLAEMKIDPNSQLVGKSIEDAKLRNLPGLFLVSLGRDGERMAPVSPSVTLQEGDVLAFSGTTESVTSLTHFAGLVPVEHTGKSLNVDSSSRRLWEVVISDSSPLVGQSLRDSDFRARYNAAVLAIHRSGVELVEHLGQTKLRPGDTLIIEAGIHFRRAFRNNSEFYLVSSIPEWRPLRRDKAWIAASLLVLMVVFLSLRIVPIAVVASIVALCLVASRCLSMATARGAIGWSVLVTIGAAFAIGSAVESSGLARVIVDATLSIGHLSPFWVLLVLYLIVSVTTEMITNNAAAILFFPVCIELSTRLGFDPRPFLIILMLAASASMVTPYGYQTNLMVYGPGGYRYRDFVWFGLPLNLILAVFAAMVVPMIWKL